MKSYSEALNTPSDINEHIPVLRELATDCYHITELGVRSIVSTWAFAMGIQSEGKIVAIDIVDPPQADLEAIQGFCADKVVGFEFIKASSLEIGLIQTDLLFIDTIHTGAQLKEELRLHAWVARKYIVLHDTVSCGPELQPVIFDFIGREWAIKKHYNNNNGLTVLCRI